MRKSGKRSSRKQTKHGHGRRWLTIALNLVLLGLAAWIIRDIGREFTLRELFDAVRHIPGARLALSILLTILGYTALVGYDFLALRYIRRPLPFRKVIIPSFIAYAISNSAPVSVLSGGGVRYRTFSRLGISALEAAKLAAFDVITYVCGLFTVGGLAFILAPLAAPDRLHIPFATIRPLGVLFLIVAAAYVGVSFLPNRKFHMFGKAFHVPHTRLVLAQVGMSSVDWLLSATALYVLLVSATPVPYIRFLAAFLLAQIVTLIAPVPGGLGVFEVVVLLLRPSGVRSSGMLAGLIGYRVIYYIVPLLLAGALFALTSMRPRPNLKS